MYASRALIARTEQTTIDIRAVASRRRRARRTGTMVDLPGLKTGLIGSAEIVVGVEHTAPSIGSGRVPVLATPVMINLIEAAALAAAGNPPARRPPKLRLPSGRPPLRGHSDRNAGAGNRGADRHRPPHPHVPGRGARRARGDR